MEPNTLHTLSAADSPAADTLESFRVLSNWGGAGMKISPKHPPQICMQASPPVSLPCTMKLARNYVALIMH